MELSQNMVDQIMNLTGVINEAFIQMQKQVEAERYDETIMLLENAMKGIESLQKAVLPMAAQVPENKFNDSTRQLMSEVGGFLESYHQKKADEMEMQMTDQVIPAFQVWKEEVETVMGGMKEWM
ncbi:hypothetical protein [Tindallia californiensis]|uniref:DUF8042 domain-containing protein n=1 Tax=Tindallia californiensis TaxID=159292 RepID=A0A1H3LA58_9FIRM|nr:hypothetical protein [Tindallia californiensis]SDY61271.1 hypothetical protein SAMN05192546_103130 [Tindallia californiensis]